MSRDSLNMNMNVIVARVTRTERSRRYPTAVELEPGTALLQERSWILCHDLITLQPAWLDPVAKGELPLPKVVEMERCLAYALDLEGS